jgi:hypothetical protein
LHHPAELFEIEGTTGQLIPADLERLNLDHIVTAELITAQIDPRDR